MFIDNSTVQYQHIIATEFTLPWLSLNSPSIQFRFAVIHFLNHQVIFFKHLKTFFFYFFASQYWGGCIVLGGMDTVDIVHQLRQKNNAGSEYRILLFSEDNRHVKQGFLTKLYVGLNFYSYIGSITSTSCIEYFYNVLF